MKGRSPTMRHASRTHRVAVDWLFDRINLDPKIQIKYVDTKHQLADILTKEISHAMSATIFFICLTSTISAISAALRPKTMAKKMQEQARQNRIVAKSKPTTMNLAVSVSTSSSTEASSRTDWSSTGKLHAKEHNQDAASSSQGWQKDAVLDVGTRKLVATEEDQEHLNNPVDSVSTSKLVASGNSETEGGDEAWPHNLHVSTNYVKIWSQPDRSNEGPRCEYSYMVYIFVCQSSSCSSSW